MWRCRTPRLYNPRECLKTIRELDMTCVRHYAQFTTIPTNWSLEKEVLSHLQRINLVKPL